MLEPDRLPAKIRDALAAKTCEISLSPLSIWETTMLARNGRLRIEGDTPTWIERALEKLPLREAPLTHEIALARHGVESAVTDPADRLLLATASVLDLILVTADRALLHAKAARTLGPRTG